MPADEDYVDRYCSRNESVLEVHSDKMSSGRGMVLAADAKKARIASDDTLLTPRPPYVIIIIIIIIIINILTELLKEDIITFLCVMK